jgi:plastocyanin
MSANIVLSLSATKLEVAPGESVEATIIIRNQSQVVDQFGIRIEGLDPTWWTLSTSSVSLFPGDQGEAKLTIHPPKEAESKAGSYSFQVRAVSQANPEEMTEVEAYLVLRGFLVWDVEMSPTKVAGRSGTYRLTASNSGNTDMTLIFEGKDPEEALDYTFSHDKVTVPAGESALITLKVRPRKEEKDKLYSFQVLVRPAEAKVSSKEVKTINGKLEYKRRRWPWKWILLGLAIVAVAIIVWKFIIPPPLPVINSFTADPESIAVGESSTLSWNVSGAATVTIDQEVEGVDLDPTAGTYTVSPTKTTTYTLEASNKAGSKTKTVKVTAPPFINSYTADPTKINVGDSSTFRWNVSDADTVTIDPGIGPVIGPEGLNANEGEIQVSPTATTTYTFEASNEAGSVTRNVTVTVPLPIITSFTADPISFYIIGGDSTLSWTVTNDPTAELTSVTITSDNPDIDAVSVWVSGSRNFAVYKTTTFTLEAINQNGSVTATVKVTVIPLIIPDIIVPEL